MESDRSLYNPSIIESLERHLGPPDKLGRVSQFNHLHPAFISRQCPFRTADVFCWRKDDFEFHKKRLGSGSYGKVYKATHKRSGHVCAIKLMSKSKFRKTGEMGLLFQEIYLHNRLGYHPNIVAFYGCFDVPEMDKYAIVLEYVPGTHLLDFLNSQKNMPFFNLQCIFGQVLSAIKFCHENHIIHRDLKSDNLLIDAETGQVKLSDFGYAIQFHQYMGDMTGTKEYMAPEVFAASESGGRIQYGPEIDVWALGILLYELMIGDVPFEIDEMDHSKHQKMMLRAFKHPEAPLDLPFIMNIPSHLRSIVLGLLQPSAIQRMRLKTLWKNKYLFDDNSPFVNHVFDYKLMRSWRYGEEYKSEEEYEQEDLKKHSDINEESEINETQEDEEDNLEEKEESNENNPQQQAMQDGGIIEEQQQIPTYQHHPLPTNKHNAKLRALRKRYNKR